MSKLYARMSSKRLTKRLQITLLLLLSVLAIVVIPFIQSLGPNKRQSLMVMYSSSREHVPNYLPLMLVTTSNQSGEEETSVVLTKEATLPQMFTPDYSPGVEDIFLMVKTGATVLWKRLPVHFGTTFRKVPYFQVYSDMAEEVMGHTVVDCLVNSSEILKSSDEFGLWRLQQQALEEDTGIHPQDDPAVTASQMGWDLDKYKNLPMLAHAYKLRPQAKWFVFMDADSYILWDSMVSWLSSLNHQHVLYMGSAVGLPPARFAHGGSGVVISQGAMQQSFGAYPNFALDYEEQTQHDCCGDHMIARAFHDLDIHISDSLSAYPYAKYKMQGEPQRTVFANSENWCAPLMSFHHVSPRDIEQIAEFEDEFRKTHEPGEMVRYVDVYHKFVHPYLAEMKDEWNNWSNDIEYTMDPSKTNALTTPAAWESFEKCKEMCDNWDKCMGFRHKSDFCGLSSSVRLGRKAPRVSKEEKVDESLRWRSGWRLDRIAELRAKSGCDNVEETLALAEDK